MDEVLTEIETPTDNGHEQVVFLYICNSCGKTFDDMCDLENHMCDLENHISCCNLIPDEKKDATSMRCSTCDQCFETLSEYETHQREHTEEVRYPCPTCCKEFRTPKALRKHAVFHKEKTHICTFCNKGFTRQADLNKHTRCHSGERPFACELCGKSFKLTGHLNRHISFHNKVKPFQCNKCEKAFTQKCDLDHHLVMHTGQKPAVCDICDKGFSRRTYLRKHKRIIHHLIEEKCNTSAENCDSLNGQKIYVKSEVAATFLQRTNDILDIKPLDISQHPTVIFVASVPTDVIIDSTSADLMFNRISNDINKQTDMLESEIEKNDHDEKPFECNGCDKKFHSVKSLKRHKYVHKVKSYLCKYCKKGFINESDLRKHSRSHTGERPFTCGICGNTFKLSNHLRRHERFHQNVRPFKCLVCPKAFAQRDDLLKHHVVHTGVKPGVCNVCGKAFSRMSYLQKHKKKVHPCDPVLAGAASEVENYICNTCGKEFLLKTDLLIHNNCHTETTKPSSTIAQLEDIGTTNVDTMKRYACHICGKLCKYIGHLETHMKTHLPNKKGPTCMKQFRKATDLETHMRIHSGVTPFKCETCDKCFTDGVQLTQHMKCHKMERLFSCLVCDESFATSDDLIEHGRIHTEDAMFVCSRCDIAFNQTQQLKQHMDEVHQINYICRVCYQSFENSDDFQRHERTHQGSSIDQSSVCHENVIVVESVAANADVEALQHIEANTPDASDILKLEHSYVCVDPCVSSLPAQDNVN